MDRQPEMHVVSVCGIFTDLIKQKLMRIRGLALVVLMIDILNNGGKIVED